MRGYSQPAERNPLSEQCGLHHDRIVREAEHLCRAGPPGEETRIFFRPVAGPVSELDDGVSFRRIDVIRVPVSRTANRQHDFLHHQRPAGLRLISIAETHTDIDILHGTSQRAGNQLEAKIDTWKLPLQFVDAWH